MPFPRVFDERVEMDAVGDIVPNSPECSWHRTAGQLVSKTFMASGGAGAKVYNLFEFSGSIEVKDLHIIFHSAGDTTTFSDVKFVWHDGTNPHDLTDVVDASGAGAGSIVSKEGVAASAAVFVNGSTGGIEEVANQKPLQVTLMTAKYGATNKIQLQVTQDGDTSAVLHAYCSWICKDEGSSLEEY